MEPHLLGSFDSQERFQVDSKRCIVEKVLPRIAEAVGFGEKET